MKKNDVIKKGSKFFSDFKSFIAKGNVIDLAVGVIIGNAFGKIVTSIVNDVIMPAIGIISGGINFTNLSYTVKDSTIAYGNLIQNVIDFFIIAACIFVFVKVIERFTKKKQAEVEETIVEEVKKDEHIVLLEEIRDLLKKESEVK